MRFQIFNVSQELSGLGDRKKLRASDMEDRYNNMCRVAMTRSIISLGISVFRQHSDGKTTSNGTESDENVGKGDPPDPTSDGSCFSCLTWNVMVLCGDDYIVEPGERAKVFFLQLDILLSPLIFFIEF